MNTNEAIKKALPIFLEYKHLENEDLLEIFIKNGFVPAMARKIVVFMPIAFGRIIMNRLRVETSDEFEIIQRNGGSLQKRRRKLNDVEIYREAFKVASALSAEEMSDDTFLVIANRSVEVNIVSQMKSQGENPEDVVLTPMATMWEIDEEPPQDKTESMKVDSTESTSTKGWWQFWK